MGRCRTRRCSWALAYRIRYAASLLTPLAGGQPFCYNDAMSLVLALALQTVSDAAADELLKEMSGHIGDGAVVERVDDLYFVGSDGGGRVVDRGKRTLASMKRGLYKDFLKTKPAEPLKVYLFAGAESYEKFCRDVRGEEPGTPFGFYSSADRALIMNIDTGYGTLAHELVHPLAAADFPDIPAWFNEGFASLYEQSTSKDDGTIWGLVNWRLEGLQKNLDDVDLEAVMKTTTRQFYGSGSGFHYAQARYLCLWLQEEGKLPAFYAAFRDGYADDPTGISQFEKVTGKTPSAIQPDWKQWVAGLEFR